MGSNSIPIMEYGFQNSIPRIILGGGDDFRKKNSN